MQDLLFGTINKSDRKSKCKFFLLTTTIIYLFCTLCTLSLEYEPLTEDHYTLHNCKVKGYQILLDKSKNYYNINLNVIHNEKYFTINKYDSGSHFDLKFKYAEFLGKNIKCVYNSDLKRIITLNTLKFIRYQTDEKALTTVSLTIIEVLLFYTSLVGGKIIWLIITVIMSFILHKTKKLIKKD